MAAAGTAGRVGPGLEVLERALTETTVRRVTSAIDSEDRLRDAPSARAPTTPGAVSRAPPATKPAVEQQRR